MLVCELIYLLKAVNPEAKVHMGYDGNIVVTQPVDIEEILGENQIGDCWWQVHAGDVVILGGS